MYNNSNRRFSAHGRQRSMTPNIRSAFSNVVKSVKNLTSPAIIKAKKDDDYYYYNRNNHKHKGGFLDSVDGISSYFGQKSIVSKIRRNPLYLALFGLFSLIVTIFIVFHFVQPSSSHTLVNSSNKSSEKTVEEKIERQYTSFNINKYVSGSLKGKIDNVLSLYDEKLLSQFDNSIELLVEDYCVNDLPFKLSTSSKLNLHAHISEIFYYIHQHGRIDEIDSKSTVVGSDGSIYDTQHTHHHAKEHGHCRLVPELIEASKIINKDSMIHDKEDQFANSYDDYKNSHDDITGNNIYKDASTIIKLASSLNDDENNIYKYEMDMYWALDSYCNNIYKDLSYNNQYKVATNVINSVKELYNSKGRQYVNHNELKMVINKDNAEINYYNVNEFHKYSSNVLTCPLLDVIMEYQVGTTQSRIERMLNEYKNHEMIIYEEHLDHLISDECNLVNNKLNKNSYSTFKNHLQSFISNIISKEAMGNKDYIVTNDGFIMHRLHANELNIATSEYNECPLLEKLANFNQNNNPIIDEDIYSRDSQTLKNEKQDIKKHKYNLNARHDVYTLLQHLKKGERYEFSSLLDDLVNIYDENVIKKFNDKKLINHLVASYEEAFYAILDNKCPDAITKEEVLAININDGYIYTQKPSSLKDPMYKSVFLEEIYNNLIAIKTQNNNNNNNNQYKIDDIDLSNKKNDIKGPLKINDVKELIKLTHEKDFIALNDILELHIESYAIEDLMKIYNKFHKDNNDYTMVEIKENFMNHIITLLELMDNHNGLPSNTILALTKKGHIVAVTEDDLNNEYKYISSVYLNELVWFATQLNTKNNNKIDEHLLETESHNSNQRSSHTNKDNKYFSDLLIMDVMDDDEFSFNDDLKYALNINCNDDNIYKNMGTSDQRTLRIQTLHYLKKVLKDKSKLNQFNLKNIGFTTNGVIVNTEQYSSSSTSKCLINHLINQAVQKIK